MASREIHTITSEFGVSVDQAERNLNVQRRASKINIVEQIEAKLGESFAGLWFDNETGQFVVPVVTGSASTPFVAQDRKAAIAGEFAAAALAGDYRIEPVKSNRSDLVAEKTALEESLSGIDAGISLQTAIDPTRNAVTLAIPESVPSSTFATVRRIATTADVQVVIDLRPDKDFSMRPAGCTAANNSCDRPFRGGQQMWATVDPNPSSETVTTCTAGFRANGLDGKKYVVTAGHCVKNANSGAVFWHWMAVHSPLGRRSVGTTSQFHWPGKDWAKLDATGHFWDVAPWHTILGLPDWGVHDYPITGEERSYVGQTLCHTGANTATSCGIVTEEEVSAEYSWNPNEKVNGMFEVRGSNLCLGEGDSGGPVFANNTALGIVSGGSHECDAKMFFSDIMAANKELGVNIAGPGAPEAITGAPYEEPFPPNTTRNVSGQVNPRGLPTSYQIEYGVGGFHQVTSPVSVGAGQGFVSVWQTLTGLKPGTTYQYRIKATNSLNTAYGAPGTFKTNTVPSINGNLPTQGITNKQATIRASINPNNDSSTWWFEWGPTEAMGKEGLLGTATGLSNVEVKTTLSGLSSSTKYWYRVIVFNSGGWKVGPTGTFTTAAPGWLSRFGGTGTEPGQFKSEIALTTDQVGNVYVADRNNHRIQKFDPDGNFLMQFGVKGSAPGQLTQPQAVATDQQGDIWVAEATYKRIQEFTPTGEFIREIGPNEGVNRPSSTSNLHLALGGNGDIYLAQEGNIFHYSPIPNGEGKYFLGKATGTWVPEGIVKHPGNGQMYFLSEEAPRAIFKLGTGTVPSVSKVCDVPLTTTPEIKNPEGFIIDPDGNGLITSKGTSQVVKVKLTSPCNALSGFGAQGVGPGQMMYPTSLALSPSGLIFVGDGQHTTAPGPGITRWAW